MRRPVLFAGVVAVVLLAPTLAAAHPLGNFTINRYAAIELTPGQVRIGYVVDMAEIPTVRRSTPTRTEPSRIASAPAGPLALGSSSSRT
jgi:nickel/cobalt exporter